MIRFLKRIIAQHKLARDVERRRNSFECEQYRRRRAAALKGLGRCLGLAYGRCPVLERLPMTQHLLADIEAFCGAQGISESKFGVLAVNDWKFVRDLRGEGRSRPRRVWPDTEQNVRRFMATYSPARQDAAA